MKRNPLLLALLSLLIVVSISGCGDPLTRNAASRGRFQFRNWLRYEFQKAKSFSYGESQIKENKHVIGYEPSWLVIDSLYLDYPYQLLSELVIGEYDVNYRTGFSRHDSATSAFRYKDIVQVATAVNEDINVLLAVTDYGDYGYRREFLSEIAKKNLLNSLDLMLTEISDKRSNPDREKVGVMLDFPSVTWNLRKDYLEFLRRLNNDLDNREAGKGCMIYSVLPLLDPDEIYADSMWCLEVRKNVDVFVLRAHNFGKPMTKNSRGPVMPIDWPGMFDLDSVVNYYTKTCDIPASKIVVEFPYYGTVMVNDTVPHSMEPLVPLNEIINLVESKRVLDTIGLAWKRPLDTLSFFYEDTLSLNVKYDWVNRKKKLAGIGIYGLGYGHGMDEPLMKDGLWAIIADNFAEPAPRLLFIAIGYLLSFIAAGIVISVVMYWQVRYALRATMGRFWYYLLLFTCLITAIVFCILPVTTIGVMWKLIALALLLIFPLGRKAMKYILMARK